ncbi:MAG: hypothetical protein KC501_00595 [Myxococcales bacterium]|nr:hypothetical protein [Myxococcales bacterium]
MRSRLALCLAAWLVASLLPSCRSEAPPVPPEPGEASVPELAPASAPQDPPSLAVPSAVPPISLTTSDGTGLSLAAVEARAALEEPLALTELELSFDNPRDDTIEGRFEILLPPGARVTRFAMWIDDHWQEAEVVEKQRARRTYESHLHRRRDPALLERDTGNRFRARVFPIAPRQRKRLLVTYQQAFEDPREPYRLAVRGLPWLERLELRVQVVDPATGRARVEERRREQEAPTEDLVIPRHASATEGIRHGERIVARVEPLAGLELDPAEPPSQLTVLVDTSASQALAFDDAVEGLGRLLAVLTRRVGPIPLRVLAFDQEVVPLYEGSSAGFDEAARARLHARRPLGASDLERALEAVATEGTTRVLLVSDGLVSAGRESSVELDDRLAALARVGVRRLDALVMGSVRDEARLHALVVGALPHGGVVLDPADDLERAVDRLLAPTFDGVTLEVPGASWWSPTRLDGLQPGDHVLVHAERPGSEPAVVRLSGPVSTEQVLPLRTVGSPLVDRAWAAARVEAHLARLEELHDLAQLAELRQQAIDLSVEHRILNDLTAMLVLETESDYAAFGLDRRALRSIMVVGDAGVELLRRAPSPSLAADSPESRSRWRRDGAREVRVAPVRRVEPTSIGGSVDEATEAELTEVGRTTDLEDFRNIPVGAAVARDFTAVEDSSATVSSDSAQYSPLRGISEPTVAPGLGVAMMEPPAFPSAPPRYAKVRLGRVRVDAGPLSSTEARQHARGAFTELQQCYWEALEDGSRPRGRVTVELELAPDGHVSQLRRDRQIGLRHDALLRCLERHLGALRFPASPGASSRIRVSLAFLPRDGRPPSARSPARRARKPAGPRTPEPLPDTIAALTGTLGEVHDAIDRGELDQALETARAWREAMPSDVLALVALGDAARARGDLPRAARAYGSILDLYPSRADMRRFAAGTLEALDDPRALALAVDAYRKARDQRPDHPSSHRNLALALLRHDDPRAAFEALAQGLERSYPEGRFAQARRILAEDLGIVAAAWSRQRPTDAMEIRRRLTRLGVAMADAPTLRFVLSWETDANDVDLHVQDAAGGHAFYAYPILLSGGSLYADVTNGYGPECLTVPDPGDAYPYRLSVHYYSRGSMGYGMGKVQVLLHDGEGRVRIEDRPFVVMQDQAQVDLGLVWPSSTAVADAAPPRPPVIAR